MHRLALLILVASAGTAGAAPAEDAPFCASMCGSEQRACRADAQLQAREPRFPEARNPLARTAQGEIPGQATRALETAGDNHRKQAGIGACDSAFQRCMRSCAAQPASGARAPAAAFSRHAVP